MRCVRAMRSLVNSVVIVLLLTGILLRVLHREIIGYKKMESSVRLFLRLSFSLPSRLSPVPRALGSGAHVRTRSRD